MRRFQNVDKRIDDGLFRDDSLPEIRHGPIYNSAGRVPRINSYEALPARLGDRRSSNEYNVYGNNNRKAY